MKSKFIFWWIYVLISLGYVSMHLYAEYIMVYGTSSTGLDEAQAGIKIAGININNLRHADDITLRVESEEE